MPDNEPVRLHAWVEGRVQGVGFRFFVVERAEALGITGWVRNTFDDKVEVVAEGDRTVLEKLLSALRLGPRAAYVTQVHQEWNQASGEFSGFHVRSSG